MKIIAFIRMIKIAAFSMNRILFVKKQYCHKTLVHRVQVFNLSNHIYIVYSVQRKAQFSSTVGHEISPSLIIRSISSGYQLFLRIDFTDNNRITGVFFSFPLRNTVFDVVFFVFSFRALFPTTKEVLEDTYLSKLNRSSSWKLYDNDYHTTCRSTCQARDSDMMESWKLFSEVVHLF